MKVYFTNHVLDFGIIIEDEAEIRDDIAWRGSTGIGKPFWFLRPEDAARAGAAMLAAQMASKLNLPIVHATQDLKTKAQAEVDALVEAMNKLPGISVSNSGSPGDGDYPVRIWFKSDPSFPRGLDALAYLTCPRYFNYGHDELRLNPVWKISIDHGDIEPRTGYLLEGHPIVLIKEEWERQWGKPNPIVDWPNVEGCVYPPAVILAARINAQLNNTAIWNILTRSMPSSS